MGSSQYTNLVLFDGVCNLCNGFVRFLIRRDRKRLLSFGTLQSETARDLILQINPNHRIFDTVVYLRRGRIYVKSGAALRIVQDLGGIWGVAGIFWLIPRTLRDIIYDWIARNRYRWLGKRTACMVPTPELKSRFLPDS